MDEIRTGDVLLCCNNTATGFMLRTATSSRWNHVGIAIRMEGDKVVSETGKLYMLELNADARMDALTQTKIKGMTLTDFDWLTYRYNLIATRHMRSSYRTTRFVERAGNFVKEYHGSPFSYGFLPFIGVWLGVPIGGDKRKDADKREFFCSEMVAYFYRYCTGLTLKQIFGFAAPSIDALYLPGHFSIELTAHSPIFEDQDETVYVNYSDAVVVMLQPLIVVTFVIVIFSMILRS